MPKFSEAARKLPGVAQVQGAVTGLIADERDLPITDYDKQNAGDIASKLKGCSQRELRTIDAYERKHANRATITDKIAKLVGDEPWPGYDEQSVDAIKKVVSGSDAQRAEAVLDYERAHKDRVGVVQAVEQRLDE
jgi:uncharacterized protein (UPF0335 family)